MDLSLGALNWGAVAVSVIAGQVISTVWFVVLFAEPWAKEYGAASAKEHTADVPGYTYGVQLLCTVLMVLTLAVVQRWAGVASASGAIGVGVLVSVGLCIATGLPGQAFLRRWKAAAMALGSQVVMIMAASLILGLWR